MVKRSISTGKARDDLVVSTENPSGATRRRHTSPISIALAISIVVVAGYAAFNRIGTTANADSVEFTQNLAGGFLAVGMTKDQPGFMVLSALDREKVDVNTDQAVNRVTGTHTVVEVQTPHETMRIRLRGPQIVLVSEEGAVERHEVGLDGGRVQRLARSGGLLSRGGDQETPVWSTVYRAARGPRNVARRARSGTCSDLPCHVRGPPYAPENEVNH